MQSPCKLVFTAVFCVAVPREHMYSNAYDRLRTVWAIWLKLESVVGKRVAACTCALVPVHPAACLRPDHLVLVYFPGFLPPYH